MKIYISADIEGVSCISTWQESDMMPPAEARARLTREALIACQTAIDCGATEILLKDAHGYGKNICHENLPKQVKLMNGWANHPYNMIEGIDDTYDGIIFLGYHSPAGSIASPLSHTLDTKISRIKLNGKVASEFLIYHTLSNFLKVPTLLVTGDCGLIRDVKSLDSNIESVATKEGFGGALISNHPDITAERIAKALKRGFAKKDALNMEVAKNFELEVSFKEHKEAYRYSFFPKVKQINSHTVKMESKDYFDILTFLVFV